MKGFLIIACLSVLGFLAWPSGRQTVLAGVDLVKHQLTANDSNAERQATDSRAGNTLKITPAGVELPTTADFRNNSRTWKFANGKQAEGVLIAANSKVAQLRLAKTQRIHNLSIAKFAETDRGKINDWIEADGRSGVAGFPVHIKSHRWPSRWQGPAQVAIEQIGNSKVWRSKHFDITDAAGVDRAAIESIAMICESVDGALNALPLPLPVNWGRSSDRRRQIVIEGKSDNPELANAAGYWDGRTGKVHIYIEHLFEPNQQRVVFEYDKPAKVQKYDVIVHEVTHQSMAALLYMDVPAWVAEGMSEYMAATQFAPATYQFTNTFVSLRYHINKLILGDRIVKDRRMHFTFLKNLMNRDVREWNGILASDGMAGGMQYHEALLLVDYFFHVDHPDGLYFKRYLEAILSGVPEKQARDQHLMRGRSYEEIENDLIKRWQPVGFSLVFQNKGEIRNGDVDINWQAEDIQRTVAAQRMQ